MCVLCACCCCHPAHPPHTHTYRDVKYLYDGECPMCNSLKKVLERQDNRRGQLAFVDISDPYYDPMQNMVRARGGLAWLDLVRAWRGGVWCARPARARHIAATPPPLLPHQGIEYDEAMETIHAIKTDGTVSTPPALTAASDPRGLPGQVAG